MMLSQHLLKMSGPPGCWKECFQIMNLLKYTEEERDKERMYPLRTGF